VDTGSALNSHAGHFASLGGAAVVTTDSMATSHSHGAVYFTSAERTALSLTAAPEPSAASPLDQNLTSGSHDQHAQAGAKLEAKTKLLPKRCTVTYSGGLLVTSVDGKRQCDCDGKAKAAQQVKEQLADHDEMPAGLRALAAALVDCQPCQLAALNAAGAESGVCSFFPAASMDPLEALFPASLTPAGPGTCPEREAHLRDEAWGADADWLRGVQIVGLSMLAASVALLPTLRGNTTEDETQRTDDFWHAVGNLRGRLHVEPLAL
jgi:hypothetical protein